MKKFKEDVLSKDFTETVLTKADVISYMTQIEEKKKEIAVSFARNLFMQYSGKNLGVQYTDGREIYVICRGTRFYVYDEASPYVDPIVWDFNKVIEDFVEHDGIIDMDKIASYRFLSREEATECLRAMYMKRANKSKELFAELLTEK